MVSIESRVKDGMKVALRTDGDNHLQTQQLRKHDAVQSSDHEYNEFNGPAMKVCQ